MAKRKRMGICRLPKVGKKKPKGCVAKVRKVWICKSKRRRFTGDPVSAFMSGTFG